MSRITPEYIKKKMIKRILRNSEVLSAPELKQKNVAELIEIQDKGLINLRLKLKFRNKNLSNQNIRTY